MGQYAGGALPCGKPAFELSVPALTYHRLVFVARPPDALELRYDEVKQHHPTPAGSITLVPAGSRSGRARVATRTSWVATSRVTSVVGWIGVCSSVFSAGGAHSHKSGVTRLSR